MGHGSPQLLQLVRYYYQTFPHPILKRQRERNVRMMESLFFIQIDHN